MSLAQYILIIFFSQSQNQSMPQSTSVVAGNHGQFFITFSFINVTQLDVLKAFKSIKSNAIGSDNIPPKLIKLILHHILPQITFLINSVITTSTFPLCC